MEAWGTLDQLLREQSLSSLSLCRVPLASSPPPLPISVQAGSAAQPGLPEGLVIPSLLLGRGPALGLLIKARGTVAGQQGSWPAAVVTPGLFQFAFVEEEFLEKFPNTQPGRLSYSMERGGENSARHTLGPLPGVFHTPCPATRIPDYPGLPAPSTPTGGRRSRAGGEAQKGPKHPCLMRPQCFLPTEDHPQDSIGHSPFCYHHLGGWADSLEASAPCEPHLPCGKPFGKTS